MIEAQPCNIIDVNRVEVMIRGGMQRLSAIFMRVLA